MLPASAAVPTLREVVAGGEAGLCEKPGKKRKVRRAHHGRGQGHPRSKRRAGEEGEEGVDSEEPQEFQPHHALNVPREADLGSLAKLPDEGEPATTIMLRHIPCRYTQGSLLREIDSLGFEGRYDFFYLPMDMRNKTSVGYAFINFLDATSAAEFSSMMQDYRFQRYPSDKIAEASPANLQGLRNNVLHFSKCSVMRAREPSYRPIVLQKGFKRDFAELVAELAPEEQVAATPRPRKGAAQEAARPPVRPVVHSIPSDQSFVPSGELNSSARTFLPSGALNASAKTFVPGAAPQAKAFGQDALEVASSSSSSASVELNPLAQEFVPSMPPPGLPPPGLAPALAPRPAPLPAPTAAAVAAPLAAAPPRRLRPDPPSEPPPPPEPALMRRGLEEAVANLLRKRQEEASPTDAAANPTPSAVPTPPKAEPLAEQEPPRTPPRRQRPAPRALESLEGARLELASEGAKRQETEGEGGGGWADEAFDDLVQDMLPAGKPEPGDSNDSDSWIREAFVALIDDDPSALGQGGGGWVAEAFGKLAGCTPSPRPRRLIGALLSPASTEPSGGWIAEAFSTLVNGCKTPVAKTWHRPTDEQQLGWVAEALRAFGKRQGDRLVKDSSMPASGASTPRSISSHTPRHLDLALQRLRSMGGWAWVAFA